MIHDHYYEDDDPRWVYAFFAADGRCLYVGVTVNLPARLGDHRHQQEWWPEVTCMESYAHPGRAKGEAAERALIRQLDPVHNTVFTAGNQSGRKSWVTRRANAAITQAAS